MVCCTVGGAEFGREIQKMKDNGITHQRQLQTVLQTPLLYSIDLISWNYPSAELLGP